MTTDNSRAAIVARFRERIARGEAIIGGGAGTGISAKSEEAGGIDLLIVYNSSEYGTWYRTAKFVVRYLVPYSR